MCIGSPSAPTPPPRAPAAAQLPNLAEGRSSESVDIRDAKRRRAAGGSGGRSTILTGARGVQDNGAVAQKTLLGA